MWLPGSAGRARRLHGVRTGNPRRGSGRWSSSSGRSDAVRLVPSRPGAEAPPSRGPPPRGGSLRHLGLQVGGDGDLGLSRQASGTAPRKGPCRADAGRQPRAGVSGSPGSRGRAVLGTWPRLSARVWLESRSRLKLDRRVPVRGCLSLGPRGRGAGRPEVEVEACPILLPDGAASVLLREPLGGPGGDGAGEWRLQGGCSSGGMCHRRPPRPLGITNSRPCR